MTLSLTNHQLLSTADHAPTQPVDTVNHKWPQQLESQPAASFDSADDIHYIQPDFSAVVKS